MVVHDAHHHSTAAVGRLVRRSAYLFALISTLIPFYILIRDDHQATIWWLKPYDVEDLELLQEESELLKEEGLTTTTTTATTASSAASASASSSLSIKSSTSQSSSEKSSIKTSTTTRAFGSRWAKEQRQIAASYSISLGKSSFCATGLSLKNMRPSVVVATTIAASSSTTTTTGTSHLSNEAHEPAVWDAVLGDHGSMVHVIVTPPLLQLQQELPTNRTRHRPSPLSSSYSSSTPLSSNVYFSLQKNKRVLCRLYDHRHQLLATVMSMEIVNQRLLRCPVPHDIVMALGLSVGTASGTGSAGGTRLALKLMWPGRDKMGSVTINPVRRRLSSNSGSGSSSGSESRSISTNANNATSMTPGSTVLGLLPVAKVLPKILAAAVVNRTLSSGPHPPAPRHSRPLYPVCPLPVLPVGLLSGSGGTGAIKRSLAAVDGTSPSLRGAQPIVLPSNAAAAGGSPLIGVGRNGSASLQLPEVLPGWSSAHRGHRLRERRTGGLGSVAGTATGMMGTTGQPEPPYALSICAATSRGGPHGSSEGAGLQLYRKELLVEWLEYHRLLGVQHFFLYDTYARSLDRGRSSNTTTTTTTSTSGGGGGVAAGGLRAMLADYMALGVVTVVPWPYAECDGSKASSRPTGSGSADCAATGSQTPISSPPLRDTALLSCYSRFRRSSSWMALLSPDEFIGLDIARPYRGQSFADLPALLSLMESADPHRRLAAVEMQSLAFLPCARTPISEVESSLERERRNWRRREQATVEEQTGTGESSAEAEELRGGKPSAKFFGGRWLGGLSLSQLWRGYGSMTSSARDEAAPLNRKGDEENTPASPRFGTFLHAAPILVAHPPDTSSSSLQAGDKLHRRRMNSAARLRLEPYRRLLLRTESVVLFDERPVLLPLSSGGEAAVVYGTGADRLALVEVPPSPSLDLGLGFDADSPPRPPPPLSATTQQRKQAASGLGPEPKQVVFAAKARQRRRLESSSSSAASASSLSAADHKPLYSLSDPAAFSSLGLGVMVPTGRREAKRAPPGREAKEGEYFVAELPLVTAGVMTFRVVLSPSVEDDAASAAKSEVQGRENECPDQPRLAALDVVDLPLLDLIGQTPPPATAAQAPRFHFLHSSPLSALCGSAPSDAGAEAGTGTGTAGGRTGATVKFHVDYSKHWEELLGDRFLRAMQGYVVEGYGKDEMDDDGGGGPEGGGAGKGAK